MRVNRVIARVIIVVTTSNDREGVQTYEEIRVIELSNSFSNDKGII